MDNIFITDIVIEKVLNVKDVEITLGDEKRTHLILTGKNGSGKTSALNAIKIFLQQIENGNYNSYHSQRHNIQAYQKRLEELKTSPDPETGSVKDNIEQLSNSIKQINNWFAVFGGVRIVLSKSNGLYEAFQNGDYILAAFEAKRNTEHNTPSGINKIHLNKVNAIDNNIGRQFIQYIVNLKADRSFAKDDNDTETASQIDKWFENFENALSTLLDTNNLVFKFDRNSYNFLVKEENKEPYNLNQLSDGFSAILSIVTELIMRMEAIGSKSYNVQGIVLIDEIETHLHIALQKKILPFLIAFFPHIQFIVTTHSPFVLSSIQGAVICDLEKNIVTNDLSGYSYDTLVESYFQSDNYSQVLKDKIVQYETLVDKESLNDEEQNLLLDLKRYLNEIPKFLSDELAVKLQQIRLKSIKKAK